ncbi:hypothetical protein BAUCODRAFT_63871 [Baudoinia panamericana UAMH 10762]|uniref:Methyltransferase domain-containing protein n=1 Tax=Baudoinia panamericana (strain UAMH 10762) TaxID=717646 RepID=M2LZI7_BAUPA|nr:uncharacterized protein BAUCODRAFT_63871 [Baudoinia panamericana UAMH 10762]EMD00103.1 hypothetical protein BAUCODRAFT_63871 [Baudoinia panamericana UAMH 10762]
MDGPRANTTSSRSSSSSLSDAAHKTLLDNPYELRHGRRYLRELPYPLPCDLPEIQRQNLRTLLGCTVFGGASCSRRTSTDVPQRVLELGCGSAYWSAMCHDFFRSLGYANVSFTGLDVAPLAPNLSKEGMDWTFVQHDIRRIPLPFDDEEFDLVMLKDMSLALPMGPAFQKLLDEIIRILSDNGTLEIWESDHVLRSLLPHPRSSPTTQPKDYRTAEQTGTFIIAPGMPFGSAQNRHFQRANMWIQNALDVRKLPPTPCARIAQILLQEPDLTDIGSRRVAIPLGELRWEREQSGRPNSSLVDSPMSLKAKSKLVDGALNENQMALRQTALITILQEIESLEPLLKEASSKNTEEWSHWWATMMNDLLDPSKGAFLSECLELGAWWATKRPSE